MEIQLKVGQTVRLRSGVIDKVCGHDPSLAGTGLEFQLEEGGRHWANGRWIRSEESGADIVEIISEPADCVTKELRELAAHVTKEFAELHERIARLERPETVNWDGQPDSPGDPFAVDWSAAPDWAMWRAVDENGRVDFYKGKPEVSKIGRWWTPPLGCVAEPHGWHDGDCKDWLQSLRRRPEPEFKRGDRVMVRDSENGNWGRLYFVRMGSGCYPYVATRSGPWAMSDNCGAGYRFCRHPTPEELEGC